MSATSTEVMDVKGSVPGTIHGAEPPKQSWLADLREIVTDIHEYRFLLFQLALRDIKIRYKQAVMGFFWAVFMPALIVLAGLLVKFAMAHFSGTQLDLGDISTLAVKAVMWAFFVGAVGFASSSLLSNVNLVTKIYFPREVLPLATTLAQVFDSAIGGLALALVLPFLGMSFSLQLLWLPPVLLSYLTFVSGLALILSCANLFFRDVKYIVQVVLMFGVFFTPVFFEPVMFGQLGARLMMLNPVAPFLEGARLSVIEGHNLLTTLMVIDSAGDLVLAWTPWYLVYGVGAALVTVIAGSLVFHRLEFVLAEYA